MVEPDNSGITSIRIQTIGYTVTTTFESNGVTPIEDLEVRIGVAYPDPSLGSSYVEIPSGVYNIDCNYHIFSPPSDYVYTINSLHLDSGAKYLLKFESENEFDSGEETTRSFTLIREQ